MSALSEQYAIALFELAEENKEALNIEEAFKAFVEGVDTKTTNFFLHPGVEKAKKKDIIRELTLPETLKNLFYLLVDKNRFDYVEAIYESFKDIRSNQANEMHIVVFSKKPLSEKRVDALKDAYEAKYHRSVTIENKLDESIVGGLRFEFDGKVIDDTVNSTLKQFQSRLTN